MLILIINLTQSSLFWEKNVKEELSRSGCAVGMSVKVVLITLIDIKRASPLWAASFTGFWSLRIEEMIMIKCGYEVISCFNFMLL